MRKPPSVWVAFYGDPDNEPRWVAKKRDRFVHKSIQQVRYVLPSRSGEIAKLERAVVDLACICCETKLDDEDGLRCLAGPIPRGLPGDYNRNKLVQACARLELARRKEKSR